MKKHSVVKLAVYLPPDWVRHIKIEAARRGTSGSAVVALALLKDKRLGLKPPDKPAEKPVAEVS